MNNLNGRNLDFVAIISSKWFFSSLVTRCLSNFILPSGCLCLHPYLPCSHFRTFAGPSVWITLYPGLCTGANITSSEKTFLSSKSNTSLFPVTNYIILSNFFHSICCILKLFVCILKVICLISVTVSIKTPSYDRSL